MLWFNCRPAAAPATGALRTISLASRRTRRYRQCECLAWAARRAPGCVRRRGGTLCSIRQPPSRGRRGGRAAARSQSDRGGPPRRQVDHVPASESRRIRDRLAGASACVKVTLNHVGDRLAHGPPRVSGRALRGEIPERVNSVSHRRLERIRLVAHLHRLGIGFALLRAARTGWRGTYRARLAALIGHGVNARRARRRGCRNITPRRHPWTRLPSRSRS